MSSHVCPWWGGYFIDNPLRLLLHKPARILAPDVRPGMTALDFGCGMGLFSIALARLVGPEGRVISADLQPRMLDVLRKRAARAGVGDRIETHLCQPCAIGLGQAIDFALAFYSVHEVPDPARLVAEVFAALRPGGRLLVAEPIGHVCARDFAATIVLVEQAGFAVVERPLVRLSHAAVFAKP